MKTQRLVVNQKNNKIYRIPNHFPMGICISIEFILKSKLELARISQTEKFFVCAGNISFLKNFARRIAAELVIT